MPTYTLQQRIFMYDSYVITSSCREVVRRFQANYSGVRVPSSEAVRLLVNKLRETGSILHKKWNVKRLVLMEQKLEEIGERLEKIVNVIWVCCYIRDSQGVNAGLACTRYRRPSRTVNSLQFNLGYLMCARVCEPYSDVPSIWTIPSLVSKRAITGRGSSSLFVLFCQCVTLL